MRKEKARIEAWHSFATCVAMLVAVQMLNFSAAVLMAPPEGSGVARAAALGVAVSSVAGLGYLSRELIRQWRLFRGPSAR